MLWHPLWAFFVLNKGLQSQLSDKRKWMAANPCLRNIRPSLCKIHKALTHVFIAQQSYGTFKALLKAQTNKQQAHKDIENVLKVLCVAILHE